MEGDIRAALRSLPLLEGAATDQLDRIASCMRAGRAEPGDVLGREGDAGDHFWLITEGRVAVTATRGHGERRLTEAGPGSILGELALLRGAPRTATVTALEDTLYLAGDVDALDCLLQVDSVRRELRRLASLRLAEDLRPVRARLRDGTDIVVRPLLPEDREALHEAVRRLSPDTRRRRFFSSGVPSPALVDHLIDIDFVDHFAWLALEAGTGKGMGVSRYVVDSPGEAEMAFTTLDGYQGRGLGTFLFGALGVAAVEAGLRNLLAYVLDENTAMRRVFAKAGASVSFAEPGVLRVDVEPAAAAGLLAPAVRAELAAAVHDIVTAASLALRA
ncbi:MAG TPA: GNAT family N-acetyltransferase [Acidimicrobiales bacterium]|nr:GNAT family N-acetyltransferase [Acidimicrobiales bacterium]